MHMALGIMEGKYSAIDTDDSSCRGYYITKFSSSINTIQTDLSIDRRVIFSYEMVCEGNHLFTINTNSHYYVLQKTKSINTIVSLKARINSSVNVICYDSKDVFTPCLSSISQNNYNNLSTLHIPMKEHDNIMDKK